MKRTLLRLASFWFDVNAVQSMVNLSVMEFAQRLAEGGRPASARQANAFGACSGLFHPQFPNLEHHLALL